MLPIPIKWGPPSSLYLPISIYVYLKYLSYSNITYNYILFTLSSSDREYLTYSNITYKYIKSHNLYVLLCIPLSFHFINRINR